MAPVHSETSVVKGEAASVLLSKLTMATWLGACPLSGPFARSAASMVSRWLIVPELARGGSSDLDEDYERERLG